MNRFHVKQHQGGVAMLVVLVFTLALTGIAIVSARLALLGESVARNQLDLQVARQAAEAALRDAEKDLMIANGSITFPGAACSRGIMERPVMAQTVQFTKTCARGQCIFDQNQRAQVDFTKATDSKQDFAEAWWPVDKGGRWGDAGKDSSGCAFSGGVPLGTFTGASPIQGAVYQPEYLIEAILRGEETYFRITARGFGYRKATEVVLQSYFQVPQI